MGFSVKGLGLVFNVLGLVFRVLGFGVYGFFDRGLGLGLWFKVKAYCFWDFRF